MTPKKNRRRGVVLSSIGQSKIEQARRQLEKTENAGDRLTIEELSERSRLSIATMTKVLAARIGVDKQTLDLVFVAFGLQMERADYQQPEHHEEPAEIQIDSPTTQIIDWGEAIDVSMFYGRDSEITTLTTWIQQDNCRLIALLGMGGIGKTALSVKIAQQLLQTERSFEFIIWRSLRNAPPLESLLIDIIQVLSCQQENLVSLPISALLNRLLHYLRSHRCLLVLDNGETILQSGEFAGIYRQDYEAYGELFRQAGEISHQSCLVLTSREKPETIANLEGITLPVRAIALTGLSPNDSDRLFAAIGLSSSSAIDRHKLIEVYGGNPLALKIVATSIREIFDGNVDGFLHAETTVFNGIRRLLDQQYQRLMPIERQVMTWLAIDRDWATLAQLQADIVPAVSTQGLMEALESLSRRSLIEQKNARFTQQPVVMEYMTEHLINQICAEITNCQLSTVNCQLFNTYALSKTTVKEYIRESQIRLILQPIARYLRERFRSIEQLERQMGQILDLVRRSEIAGSSYGAGNAIGLMQDLHIDLTGYTFANLTIRQACLQKTPLHQVNLARAHLMDCRFAEPMNEPHSSAIDTTGELLAMGGQDGTVQMRQASTGQLLFSVRAHTTFVLALTFSPDSKTLVSGCIGGGIKFWDVHTGNCQQTWDKGRIWTLDFSPDGRLLVAGLSDRDNSICIWDVQTAECLKILIGHSAPVCGIAFAPYPIDNRQLMVTTGQDSVVKIWDVESGGCVRTLTEHTGQIWSVCFHPDGDRFATCSFDRSIKIWDVTTGACLQTLLGHTKEVSRVRFSPDGHLLVSACTDRTARLWDTVTGKCLKVLQGHQEPVWAVEFTAGYLGSTARNEHQSGSSIAERFLVSIGLDRTVRFWEIVYQYRSNPLSIDPASISSHCLKTIQGGGEGIRVMAIHPDRQLFASGGMSESIHVWELCDRSEPCQPHEPIGTSAPTGKCLQKLTVHNSSSWTIAFHPQGKLLASGHLNGELRIWEVESGKCLHNLPTNHSYMIQFCRFSPQGDLVGCIGSTESSIRFWNIQTGECWRTIWLEAESYIFGLDFHPQGHYFVTAGHDDRVRWWDMQSGECFRSQAANEGHVWAINFHPHGHLFASVGGSPDVKIWDAESGECVRLLSGHTGNLGGVAFSPDGLILASGRSDRTIRLWDVATGECLHVLAGHTSGVTSVGFISIDSSPQILASASFDGTIRLWDVQTGECLNMFRPDRLYEGMDITGITGLTQGSIATLKSLGAIDLLSNEIVRS
ncbi:NB-ARC domain-containing protein [Chamaesiphon minutus]|uniref:WD40 repeat-containing protein n=1 Tax=Chamaesiphon minutus (strain ATCC 27169 / PCC 6605) TaxID=1173020 RepID=K9UA30_CHAP6|nr:NB-ARC domain-containing protein [Chamaesiphon minutus]AFY91690.1 WD40 repeat-containing protein [Chamaesiphon minutus PCC 6605]